MKLFHCHHCRNLVFFENTTCMRCGRRLAYLPELGLIGSLEPAEQPNRYRSPLQDAKDQVYKLCRNYTEHDVCNWAVPIDCPYDLCRSCRLSRTIPDLSRPGRREAWHGLELAKHRLVYTMLALRLPFPQVADESPGSLRFDFLADPDDPNEPRVLTGHAQGVITVNIAESDDAERERRRVQLGEPYRTLLGHLRHESGHYFFDQLVVPLPMLLESFRNLFGDEREDYGEALKRHYARGPVPNWNQQFISAYAASHPWEDWAESWAHYLHMIDSLETAASCGLMLAPHCPHLPNLPETPDPVNDAGTPFDAIMAGWFPVTYVINELNRGLGQADAYPFTLSSPAIEKLRFVHHVVIASTTAGP